MTIRFLRIFTFLMCVFTAGIVNAHTLHFGDKTIALSQTKYTTPSLAFAIGNETWYAPMSPVLIKNTLHVRFNNETYSVNNCADRIFTDTTNYTYDENGRLIGADERLWVQGKNSAYIDTEFVANSETRIKTKAYWNAMSWLFCSRQAATNRAFCFLWNSNNTAIRDDYGSSQKNSIRPTTGIYVVDKNKNVTTYTHPNGNTYTINQTKQTFTTPASMLVLQARNSPTQLGGFSGKIYYFKIWDNDVLVRNMVPVPACMRIGDFIVPENGMWDIVEQKFYGNANSTGTIIYGRDE